MTFNASTRESTDKIQTPTSFERSRNTSSGAFMVNSRSNRIEEIKFQNCGSKRFLPPRVFQRHIHNSPRRFGISANHAITLRTKIRGERPALPRADSPKQFPGQPTKVPKWLKSRFVGYQSEKWRLVLRSL